MLVPIGEQSNESDLILPAGVNLRECSVVIIGSTCQICGRDFKCITDVALHMQWRHHQFDSVLDSAFNLDPGDNRTDSSEAEMQKCDVCDEHDAADWKSYKRQINKKQIHEKRRARKLRLIIKIAGVTMTEIRLSRKYLKVHSNEYFADVSTQTESYENEKRQDDCGTNIDLSLTGRVVGNSRVQCVRPHNATNRYVDGKLAPIQGDAIACSTRAPVRKPIELNMSNGDATIGAYDPRASPILAGYLRKIARTQVRTTTNSFAGSLVDTIDVTDETDSLPRRNRGERRDDASPPTEDYVSVLEGRDWYCHSPQHNPRQPIVYQRVKSAGTTATATTSTATYDVPDESNSPRRNEEERRNLSPAAEDTSILEERGWYRRDLSSRDHLEELAVHQQIIPAGTTATSTTTSTPNSWCNKNPRHPGPAINKSTEPIEIIIDNESDDNCDEDMAKRSTASSTQVEREKLTTAEPVVDDDVQEILRITRGKVQKNDINHESPNRTEREMLVRNALGQMYVSSTQPEVIYPEKDDTLVVVKNNTVDPRDCSPSCVAIVGDDCPFPDVATFMYKTYNEKLGIYLNKLHNYNLGYCNDVPEINNNG